MSDKRWTNFWRFEFDVGTIDKMDDLIATLQAFADVLPQKREWRDAGVEVDDVQGRDNLAEGYLGFVTTDHTVAQRFGFDLETEE